MSLSNMWRTSFIGLGNFLSQSGGCLGCEGCLWGRRTIRGIKRRKKPEAQTLLIWEGLGRESGKETGGAKARQRDGNQNIHPPAPLPSHLTLAEEGLFRNTHLSKVKP